MRFSYTLAVVLIGLGAAAAAPAMADESSFALPANTMAIGTIDAEALDALIENKMREDEVPGIFVAVTRGETVIYQRSSGVHDLETKQPFGPQSRARLASATKFLSALAFLALAEDKVFDLEAELATLYPDTPPAWRHLPIWRILNHSAGLPMIVSRADFNALSGNEQLQLTAKQMIAMIKDEPLDFAPGEGWRYQQSGYAILAYALEERTGLNWEALLDRHVLQPAGMKQSKFTFPGKDQAPAYALADGQLVEQDAFYPRAMSPGGGYDTTGADIIALLATLSRDAIVSTDFLAQEMFAEGRVHRVGSDAEGEGYSLATVVQRYGDTRTIGHSGGGGLAEIRYAPAQRIGIVVLTNRTGGSRVTGEVVAAISEQLFGRRIRSE
jgi:D-alanyl-D-alanine carboxypeptidase